MKIIKYEDKYRDDMIFMISWLCGIPGKIYDEKI